MISLLRPNYVPGDNSPPLLLYAQNLFPVFPLIFPPLLPACSPPPLSRPLLSLLQVIDALDQPFLQHEPSQTLHKEKSARTVDS